MEDTGQHIPTTPSSATTPGAHTRPAGTQGRTVRYAVQVGLALAFALVALAGVASAWASAASSPGQGAGGIRALQACQPGWKIVPSADPPSRYGQLASVSALAPNDIWAVGSS